VQNYTAEMGLTLSPCKAEKPALPTVTNSCKAEITACRSLIYSRKDKILACKFREKKTVTNSVVCESSGSGDPMLWELRGETVKQCQTATILQYKNTKKIYTTFTNKQTNKEK